MAAKKKTVKKTAVKAKAKTKPKAKAVKAKKPVAKVASKKAVAKKTVAKKAKAPQTARPVVSAAALEKMIQPLSDRILVLVEKPEEKTAGGLIIPGLSSHQPNRGRVLALGTGRRGRRGQLRPLDVRVGDHVLFPEYLGTPVNIEGVDLLILREEDVLGIAQ